MKQGMKVVGSMQEESLWKINRKKQVTCANCLVSTFFFFFPQLGIKKKKYMPYNHQHKYFFISEYLHPPAIPWEVLKGLGHATFDLENLRKNKGSRVKEHDKKPK